MTIVKRQVQPLKKFQQQGFSLVELIIVIVITSIIAVASTGFIVNTAKGLNDISRRAALANNLRTSLSKITMQLNNSLAGSARVSTGRGYQCLEMLPIRARSFYLRAPLHSQSTDLQAISLDKKVLGMRAILNTAANQHIYRELTNPASQTVSTTISRQSKSQKNAITDLTFSRAMQFKQASQQQQIYFIDTPISYCIEQSKLFRYTHYRASKQQPVPHSTGSQQPKLPKQEPQRVLLAQGIRALSTFSTNNIEGKNIIKVVLSAGDQLENLSLHHLIWLADE